MKNAKQVVYATIFSLTALCAVIFSSCTKDKSTGLACQNGGSFISGGCQCPSGYSGELCQESTIVYINNTFTPLSVTVNNETHVLSASGGFASFTGNAGSTAAVSAFTSGTNDSGKQVGELVTWSFTNNFPTGGASLNVPVNVPADYFYLKMANADNYVPSVNFVQVNGGNQVLVSATVSVPNNANTYGIGYYKVSPSTHVYAAASSGGGNWTFTVSPANSLNASATVIIP